MRATFRNGNLYRSGRFTLADLEVIDGRIAAITPARPTAAAADEIDLEGAFVLPGLIDAHAHLTLSPDSERHEPLTTRALKGARNASAQLAAGVTSVRDVGGPGRIALELAETCAAGITEGPRVTSSGSFVCITGGHVSYWGREADGPHEVRKAVREQRKAGARFIKVMASGGVADPREDPDLTQFTLPELRAACEEASGAGTYVAAHAHPAGAIRLCLEAGVRTIEHASFIDEAGIELALRKGAFLVPTFIVYDTIARSENLARAQRDLAARVLERKAAGFLAAVEAGVRWGVGTDAGSFMPQGQLWREIRFIHSLGVPFDAVLDAATITNAEILGDASVGRLEPGCWADAVVLDRDPAADPSALERPALVIHGGRVVRRRTSSANSHTLAPQGGWK